MSERSGAGRAHQGLRIRPALPADMEAIQAIYAHHVLTGIATFEEAPPDVGEMQLRHARIVEAGLPYLAAEHDGTVMGYSYAAAYRPRPAYRYTIEDSVYVAEGCDGRGVGSALLAALVARCDQGPWRQMVAIIGNSANHASIALHARAGFDTVGTIRAAGFKLGRWVDTVIMQRALGEGAKTPPEPSRDG